MSCNTLLMASVTMFFVVFVSKFNKSKRIHIASKILYWLKGPIIVVIVGVVTFSGYAHAIVIRHDIGDEPYFELAEKFPAVGFLDITVGADRGACTGSLIRSDLVLSAAHCFDRDSDNVIDATNVSFLLGTDVRRDVRIDPAHSKTVSQIFINNWSGSPFFDIALLELAEPVMDIVPLEFNPFSTFDVPGTPGDIGVIVGFGSNGTGLTPSEVIDGKKRAAANFIYKSNPSATLLRTDFDNPNLTAGGEDGFSIPMTGVPWPEGLPFKGDSGAPLVNPVFPESLNPRGRGQIVGITFGGFTDQAGYGEVAAYVPIALADNRRFLESHGVEVVGIPEPDTNILIGLGLVLLLVFYDTGNVRQFIHGAAFLKHS